MKNATKANNQKLYLLFEPNMAELKDRRIEYAHPEIRIGISSPSGYWEERGRIIFQANVTPTPDNFQTTDAYAGHLECNFDRAAEMGKLLPKASAKGYELAPSEHCPYKSMLIGLRGIGYTRASLAKDSGQIVSTT